MMTILLGLCMFAVCVPLLGLGMLLHGRALSGGCHGACGVTGRCPDAARSACTYAKETGNER